MNKVFAMPSIASCGQPADEVVLYAEVCCRACLSPALIRTSVERPPGGMTAVQAFKRRQLWRTLTFQCTNCDYRVAELVELSEPIVRATPPQSDPYAALPKAPLMRLGFSVLG